MQDQFHIAVVDDHGEIRDLVGAYLSRHGYRTSLAGGAAELRTLMERDAPDLIVLDIMMPGESGLDLCREIRGNSDLPIIFLTAVAEETDRIVGLELGADDYVTKPFHRDELVARIHAVVRRSKGHSQSVIKTGKLAVNLDTKTVEVDGVRVHLTGKEYQMLELLSLRKGTTLTKEMFLNHLYGGMDEPELKIIDVFICKLRKKLALACGGENYIETVWGRGYVLRDIDEEGNEVRRVA